MILQHNSVNNIEDVQVANVPAQLTQIASVMELILARIETKKEAR